MKLILLICILFSLYISPISAETILEEPVNLKNNTLIVEKVESLEERLSEIRRDQLNYSIEKDLLKEAYSSNLETINLVITIILGTFTVLGFLGIKTIGKIKEQFNEELLQFKEVRNQSEERLKEIESQQTEAKQELDKITEVNFIQDRRLKLLEVIENTTEIIRKGSYDRALEYISVGLEMDGKNITLLQLKEFCLNELQRYSEVMAVEELILNVDPENYSAGVNLCEQSILHGNIDRYLKLRDKFSDRISKVENLTWVLDAFELYILRNDDLLKSHIEKLITQLPDKKQKNIKWSLREALVIINMGEIREITPMLIRAINALQGEIEPSKVLNEQ